MSRTLRILLPLACLLTAFLPVGLTAPATAAACRTINAEQVRAESSRIEGSIPVGSSSLCYTLDLPQGTVLAAAVAAYPAVTVRAGGTSATSSCLLVGSDVGPCRLTGPGPYTLTVAQAQDGARASALDYTLTLLALTGDNGCEPVVPGAPSTGDGLVSDSLSGTGDLACRSIGGPVGPLALSSGKGEGVTWTLFGPDGARECTSPAEVTACDAPRASGSSTLVFSRGSHVLANAVRGQVADLSTTTSCGTLTPSWQARPPYVTRTTDGRLDCRLVSGLEAGDPVATPYEPTLDLLVDADGHDACRVVDLGCVATGTAPFRLLTTGPDTINTTYPVLLRKVGPTSDCPVIAPLAFGTSPTDQRPGIGCRQFTAQPGHHYVVRGVDSGYVVDVSVYGPDFNKIHCSYGDCDPVSGNVTVIRRVDDTSFTTALYDASSDDGCADPGLGLTGHSLTLRPGVVDCDRVSAPTGSRVITAARLDDGVVVNQSYVDASGGSTFNDEQLIGPTALTGPTPLHGEGPYRSLTWTQSHDPVTLSLATALPDDLGDCKTVATGGSHGSATTFKDGDPVAKCRRIPATSDPAGQAVHVGHDSGNPFATSILFGDDDEQCPGATDWVLPCSAEGSSAGTVVVAGTPTSSDTVARADVSRAPVRWRAPMIRGTVRSGQTVSVGTGDGDWFNPGGHFRFRWLLDDKAVPGATADTFTIPASATGKRLSVEVSAFHGRVTKVARSAAITVAPRA